MYIDKTKKEIIDDFINGEAKADKLRNKLVTQITELGESEPEIIDELFDEVSDQIYKKKYKN